MNWLFSIAFSVLMPSDMVRSLLIMTMTVGPVLSLFYKELTRKNEYYFYYNRGITKLHVIGANLAFNLISGLIFLTIFSHVQSFRN